MKPCAGRVSLTGRKYTPAGKLRYSCGCLAATLMTGAGCALLSDSETVAQEETASVGHLSVLALTSLRDFGGPSTSGHQTPLTEHLLLCSSGVAVC